jgi:Ribbon-helix-helix protein, copG family
MKKMKKIRLTVDVSRQLYDLLERVAEDQGVSKTDVIRRAVALMDAAHQAAKRGRKVGIAKHGEALETEFIGL